MEVTVLANVGVGAAPLRLRLPSGLSEETVSMLHRLLAEHPGESPVFIHLGDGPVLRLPETFCVDPGRGLVGELRAAFGAEAVTV
jgi:hypothetical protein